MKKIFSTILEYFLLFFGVPKRTFNLSEFIAMTKQSDHKEVLLQAIIQSNTDTDLMDGPYQYKYQLKCLSTGGDGRDISYEEQSSSRESCTVIELLSNTGTLKREETAEHEHRIKLLLRMEKYLIEIRSKLPKITVLAIDGEANPIPESFYEKLKEDAKIASVSLT